MSMMSFSSRGKLRFNPFPSNGLSSQSSQSTQQPDADSELVCTWSAHVPQSGSSPSPFPRHSHTLTATATPAGELFLFGGYVRFRANGDLYVFSTRDFSTSVLQTTGDVPTPRATHGAGLIGDTLLVCGGKTSSGGQSVSNHDSIYLLNLVSLEWTRVVINGPGPGCRYYQTTIVVNSELFVFGGQVGGKTVNDMWTLDLNYLKSQPLWESCESTPGSEKPLPRSFHVSVTTGDRIIIFGGANDRQYYNDTWSFDISTRRWTELQCTGSIPSPRSGHAAVLVDGFMYVFGGYSADDGYLGDLTALQLSTQKWFKFRNEGTSPLKRSIHTMASDGTRVFVLGGSSPTARADEISLIHVFDTSQINYPESERNAVNPSETTTQFGQKSFTCPPASSLDAHGRHVPGDDINEGEITTLEFERRLSVLFAAQLERDQRIAQQAEELAKKNALLEQAEALLEQRDAELVDVQLKLSDAESKLDKLLLAFRQQFGYGAELTILRPELEHEKPESEGDDDNADKTAAGLADLNEDGDTRELKGDKEGAGAGLASPQSNEKGSERNEG